MTTAAITAADAFGAAMHARDVAAVRAIYADDITVWHAATGHTQGKAENTGMLAALFQVTGALEYVDIKRHAIPDGVVQQHRLVGTFADGRPLPDLPCCLFIRVRDGLIASIEEYFDGATYAEVWARIGALAEAG